VLFHPEYLLAKKAAGCHVDKTQEWLLFWPPGMILDSSQTHLLIAIWSDTAGLSRILSTRQAVNVAQSTDFQVWSDIVCFVWVKILVLYPHGTTYV
jgi:hypothetical protein